MKILIVDDSKAMRMIVKRTLRQAGFGDHDVVEAEDGALGLEATASESPDLVLCDWNMPNMSGIEFLQALRAAGNNIDFGFVTSESSAEMKAAASESGALFLITKPFTADSFKTQLSKMLG
ncbi:MAG: two-component system chemotaxis response regulator CheY [Planctomycetota bacterium]|jgi:two-component system chemotaxis response regulator CheY